MLILTKTRSTHCSVQFSLYSACLVSKLVNLSVSSLPRWCIFYFFIFCTPLSSHIVGVFCCCCCCCCSPSSIMSHRSYVVFFLFFFLLFFFSFLSCHIVGVFFPSVMSHRSCVVVFLSCHVTSLVCCFLTFCHVTSFVCCF